MASTTAVGAGSRVIEAAPYTARTDLATHTSPPASLPGDSHSLGHAPPSNGYTRHGTKPLGRGDGEWSRRRTLAVGFLLYAAITAAVWTAAYFVLRHAIKQGIIGAVNQGAIGNAQNRMNLMSS